MSEKPIELKNIPIRFPLDVPHITSKLLDDHRRDGDPKVFVEKYIKEKGCRSDLRKFDEYRECSFAFDNDNPISDFACVRIGQTHVVCGAASTVIKPPVNSPEKGVIEIDFRFLGHCGNEIPDLEKKSIADLARESVKKILFHSQWLDLEQLCLVPKKYVYKLSLEILVFTFDGAIVETTLLSIISALSRYQLQKYDVDDELGTITKVEGEKIKLTVSDNIPTCSTFALITNQVLVDPKWCEELACDSLLRIALDPDSSSNDSIYLLEMTGKEAFSRKQIEYCYQQAKQRGKHFKQLLANMWQNSTGKLLSEDPFF